MNEPRLTISQVAASIQQTTGAPCPTWKVRRVMDSLAAQGAIHIERIGAYRTIGSGEVQRVADEISHKRETVTP